MDIAALKKFNIHIFAKTPSVYKRIKSMFGNNVSFIGWTSRDMYDSSVSKLYECLHLKGVSKYKRSQELIDTWALHPEWPMLHVVSYGTESTNGYLRLPCPVKVKENITLYQYKLDYDDLKTLMNTCRYHICPSYSEGFGHYINEGRSTDATVFTTNLPPMNELVKDPRCLFDVQEVVQVMLGQGAKVSRESLEKTLAPMFNDSEFLETGSRENYLKERYFFEVSLKKTLTKIISDVQHTKDSSKYKDEQE
jgi:glycosyltransferase involved in cell wall biosynthesis